MTPKHLMAIEAQRQVLQSKFDASISTEARNRLGQHATPSGLTTALVREAVRLLGPVAAIRFMDPAFGSGAFWSALLQENAWGSTLSGTAFELDRELFEMAQSLWASRSNLDLVNADFTQLTPPSQEDARFNLLVCNPPYSRHHYLPVALKSHLASMVRKNVHLRVSGLAGMHVYFALLADAWLSDGAVAAWLLPQEILHTRYAHALREYLTSRVQLVKIHQFDCKATQFPGALVSSCLVFYRKSPPEPDAEVLVTFGPSVDEPYRALRVNTATLRDLSKWHTLKDNSTCRDTGPNHRHTLGHLFRVKRGIATGANQFFILRRDQAASLGLPDGFLLPILPSPRHLPDDTVLAEADGFPPIHPQHVLLSCSLPRHAIATDFPRLDEYLAEGEKIGVDQGYLCRHRDPWYRQETRPPAPLLLTYMARDTGTGRSLRFICNKSQATAPNVYHLLYPKPVLECALRAVPTLLDDIFDILVTTPASAIVEQGRAYGGGLIKIEPNELRDLPIVLPEWLSALIAEYEPIPQLDF